jgi:predicted tellurium resistance membrane protein TerC
MTSLLTVDSLISLITLTLLEIVLGIDNVIFVSILMGRLKEEKKLLSSIMLKLPHIFNLVYSGDM